MWLGVRHTHKQALGIFSRELAPAGTGMAPGFTSLIGGRPSVSPVLRLFSFLYPKNKLPVSIHLNGELVKTLDYSGCGTGIASQLEDEREGEGCARGDCIYRLEQLAYLRSGDKGNSANIGVIARHPDFLPYIRRALTTDVIRNYFGHFLEDTSTIERYELPGIRALNFVIGDCLGGGGVASLRIDPQGKAYAQMLAEYELIGLPEFPSEHLQKN
ncbi:hypothetical protein GBAR_LOCUS12463 [Geodia barretti]|nr:hypothetical protein GBAR_LOCUS12463 [Geodia barretti]